MIGDKGMAVFDDTKDWDQKLAIYDHVIDMDGARQCRKSPK